MAAAASRFNLAICRMPAVHVYAHLGCAGRLGSQGPIISPAKDCQRLVLQLGAGLELGGDAWATKIKVTYWGVNNVQDMYPCVKQMDAEQIAFIHGCSQ